MPCQPLSVAYESVFGTAMKTALLLSPHLGDAIFSCGGLATLLADSGWRTVLATAFTPSSGDAPDPMTIHRAEDLAAAERAGFDETIWLALAEAPHRPDGDVVPALAGCFQQLHASYQPDLVLAPQGLGGDDDHRQVIAAVLQALPPARLAFYRDFPAALHAPDAAPDPAVPQNTTVRVPIAAALDRKIGAAQAYATRIRAQFPTAKLADRALRDFAVAEGNGRPAERLCGLALPAFLADAITG
jgi:LmbE family N-acetylglucosaminyl deacetylase